MSDYEDEEQLERLKAFWDENGRFFVSALVLATAGLFGWNWWQGEQRESAEGASQLFEQVAEAARDADITALNAGFAALETQFPDSPYVTQAGLRVAALHMQRGETDAAETVLRDLLARERGGMLAPLVAVRLARVLNYRNAPEDALAVLDGVADGGQYGPLVAEARGDINVALGDVEAARAAYRAALDDPGQPQLIDVRIVEMKLADLGSPQAAAAETP